MAPKRTTIPRNPQPPVVEENPPLTDAEQDALQALGWQPAGGGILHGQITIKAKAPDGTVQEATRDVWRLIISLGEPAPGAITLPAVPPDLPGWQWEQSDQGVRLVLTSDGLSTNWGSDPDEAIANARACVADEAATAAAEAPIRRRGALRKKSMPIDCRIDELERLLSEATPGPLRSDGCNIVAGRAPVAIRAHASTDEARDAQSRATMDALAAVYNAAPALLRRIRQYETLLKLIDSRLPVADSSCDEPGIAFSEACRRELSDNERDDAMTLEELAQVIEERRIVRVKADPAHLYTNREDGSIYPALRSFDREILDMVCALYDYAPALIAVARAAEEWRNAYESNDPSSESFQAMNAALAALREVQP